MPKDIKENIKKQLGLNQESLNQETGMVPIRIKEMITETISQTAMITETISQTEMVTETKSQMAMVKNSSLKQ